MLTKPVAANHAPDCDQLKYSIIFTAQNSLHLVKMLNKLATACVRCGQAPNKWKVMALEGPKVTITII